LPKIFYLNIQNFRSLKKFSWKPRHGMNCLIGFGDSGKTTILDAIDYCLGARRSAQFCDYDFHNTDTTEPIKILVAMGALEPSLLSMDAYGDYFCGYDVAAGRFEEEPGHGLETCLVLRLKVEKDLEPQWSLLSKRAKAKGIERNLRWEDRQSSSPLRLGDHPDWHLAWRRGALFERLTDEKLALNEGLSDAARKARADFGSTANKELTDSLDVVKKAADELGVPTAGAVNALLDANSVKFGTGAIALHDANNIPLSSLGTGSKRLLVAGLARRVATSASIALIDEFETGLEPHRIRSLLNTLGAKDAEAAQQVFATTHSPVVLRELDHTQLTLLRFNKTTGQHEVYFASESAQGLLRSNPEAFLAQRVIVCEGKSEMGFIRGFDQHSCGRGNVSMEALGTVLVDGGGANKVLSPANELLRLGYNVSIFMDSDVPLEAADEHAFVSSGGAVFKWPKNYALEDAIFRCAPGPVIAELLDYACSLPNGDKVDAQISTASKNQFNLALAKMQATTNTLPPEHAVTLGQAARSGAGWFKKVAPYEHIAKNILAPQWGSLHTDLTRITNSLMDWAWGKNDRT
jgi:putative ATP-dependent endonuclease of OLD family